MTPLGVLAAGPATIAYVGNSVTAQRDGYRPRLHALLCARTGHAHHAVNAGFGGVGSIASLCTIETMALRFAPKLVFIECLTGDIGVGLHRHTGAAIEAMLVRIASGGAIPCLLLLPRADRKADAAPLIALYRQIAAHHGIPAIELIDAWPDPAALLRDAVHTNDAGSDAYSVAIADRIAALPRWAECAERLYPELRDAGVTPIAPEMTRGGTASGLFRLQQPYRVLLPGDALDWQSPDHAVLGLLAIVGPHSGSIEVNGVPYDLRDSWSHYERLHAPLLREAISPGEPLVIRPLSGELRLAGLLSAVPADGSASPPAAAAPA